MIELENALIESTFLGIEDHGIFTFFLHLSYGGGAGQGFGGFFLKEHPEAIPEILRVVGVSRWEELPGHTIRARHDYGRVYAIGHFMKDQWYAPGEAKVDDAEPAPEPMPEE